MVVSPVNDMQSRKLESLVAKSRDPAYSSRKIATKLVEQGVEVSYRTFSKHLGSLGYKTNLPSATPVLTSAHAV
ncbi:hypothetical protein G9A89_022206 [Geosiphon pyriformis]|nr:hypothetical protein G9A89_022206 [Geosiphon pyriformis]